MMYKSLDTTIRKTKSYMGWLNKLKKIKDYNILDNDGDAPLTISAYYGHLEACQHILSNGGLVDFKNKYGETPLKCAVSSFGSHGNIHQLQKTIYFLIEHNANINLTDNENVSCLMEALKYGRCSEIALVLIKNGADVNAKDNWGHTPLMYTEGSKNIDLYKTLLTKGANLHAKDNSEANALYHLVDNPSISGYGYDAYEKNRKKEEEIINYLLQEGALVNNGNSDKQDSILHRASAHGYDSLVEHCLENDININIQDIEGDTAIIKACQNAHLTTIELLLSQNADITIENNQGKNAMAYVLDISERSGKEELKEIFIRYGSIFPKMLGDDDVNEIGEKGRTALITASEQGTLEKMQLLINKGAAINHQDNYGKTALMLACSKELYKKVEILLKNGADPNIQDKYGKTALIYLMDDKFYDDDDRKKFDLLLEVTGINVNL
ncbi:MAG: ankyrin repeat domain-containing protein, partial [Bacteroidota bacterium]